MPQLKSDLILSLGVEGGGVDLYRKDSGAGDGKYTVEVLRHGFDLLDFSDDDMLASGGTVREFESLAEALSDVSPNGEWAYYYPIELRPDFCDELWNLRSKTLVELKPFDGLCMEHQEAHWVRACHR